MIFTLLACATGSGEADDVCAAEFRSDGVDARVRTVGVQVPLATGGSVHVEARWPEQRDPDERWPVALLVHGAWDPAGTPITAGSIRPKVTDGLVGLHLDLPGNGRTDGENDHRGAGSREAVATALAWAAGQRRDLGGCTLAERVPGADPDDLYLIGTSNGGNLAVATLVDESLPTPPVAGLVVWETPAGAQFATVEYGVDPSVYTPGSCALVDGEGVVCDVASEPLLLGEVGGARAVCFDRDGDGACGDADVRVRGVDDALTGLSYLSPPLTAAVDAAGLDLPGYADAAATFEWWSTRDAARQAEALVARWPDLPVMILASEEDHVQSFADHPHVYGLGEALQAGGAAWTRLNPGLDWLPGNREENAPNLPLSLDDPTPPLLPEDEENPTDALLSAAVRELADRRADGGW